MLTYLRILLDSRLARMDERGASAVEYGLMVAGVALACIVAFAALQVTLKVAFLHTQGGMSDAHPPGP